MVIKCGKRKDAAMERKLCCGILILLSCFRII